MKVLLVGGTGVLSSEVLNCCITNKFDTYILNRGKRKYLIPKEAKLLCSDINDIERIKKLISGKYFDAVIDFLCYTENQIERSISIYKDSCKQFIFISSVTVYKQNEGVCIEDSPLINPIWDYSINKVACEKKLISLCDIYNIKYTIIRPAVTYGNTRIPYGIMPSYGYHWTLIARILNNKPILLWDGGENISPITRVEDFAQGTVGLLGKTSAYKQAFHIVGDEYYKWINVIKTLEEILEKKAILVDVPKEFLASEMPHKRGEILGGRSIDFRFDNSKIKSVVPSFRNTISLKEGMKKTIEHYKANGYLNGIDYSFDADIDRIVYKFQKYNKNAKQENYNIYYFDYLNENKLQDRIDYFLSRYKDILIVRFLLFAKRVIRKIK